MSDTIITPDKCPHCDAAIKLEKNGVVQYWCKSTWHPKWKNQSQMCYYRELSVVKKERDALRERVKRLEEAGGGLVAWIDRQISGMNCVAVARWNEAKEAKL